MKRLGGIITVLLVVLCLGAVISCAGTKDAVVKNSKKENISNKLAKENARLLSEQLEESEPNQNAKPQRISAESAVKILPESFISEADVATQMLAVPKALQIKSKVADKKPSSVQKTLIEQKNSIAQKNSVAGKKSVEQKKSVLVSIDDKSDDNSVAGKSNDDNSSKGSVLFTLNRADKIKKNKADEIKNGESARKELKSSDEAVAKVEPPTMSVLQERLLGYESNKKATQKPKPSVVISKKYESKLAGLPTTSVMPMKPKVVIREKAYFAKRKKLPETAEVVVDIAEEAFVKFEDYESELAVLPVISVAPIKPEAVIREKAYLAQIIPLPKIAQEAPHITAEAVANKNVVAADEKVSLPSSKPLQISLRDSQTPFGLRESFISPAAVPNTVNNGSKANSAVGAAKNVAVNTTAATVDTAALVASVPETIFAAKNKNEQDALLKEISSANKIEKPVQVAGKRGVSSVYPQTYEPEDLEEASDFEMKPDFIYPEENISGLENQETIIKMRGNGWRIDSMNNYAMKLIERKNGKDESTTFRIKNGNPGTQQIKFTRYNEAENRQETQVYSVDIKPVLLADASDKNAAPKAKNAGKSKADDDYRRTLADHLYADESYAQAAVYYKKLIDENNADSELLYKAAYSMKESGNHDAALEYYRENLAQEGNPFYDESLIEYIQLLKERKEYDKAINEVYERGLTKGVSDDCTQKLYRMLGDLFFNVKNYTEAIRTYKTVLSLYPAGSGEDKAMFYLAYALELQENPEFKEAQRFYRELLNIYPESKYVNLSRSRIGFIDRHYIKVN